MVFLNIFEKEADLNYDKIEATLLFPKMKSGFCFAINSKGIKDYLKKIIKDKKYLTN